MNEKPDLPDGWSMPDYVAKRISEPINRKPVSPEDNIQTALDEITNDIDLIEPDLQD